MNTESARSRRRPSSFRFGTLSGVLREGIGLFRSFVTKRRRWPIWRYAHHPKAAGETKHTSDVRVLFR